MQGYHNNMSHVVEILCTWSLSANPLVKNSKFLSQPNLNSNDVRVLDQITALVVQTLLPVLGLDLERPWASLDQIRKLEYERAYKELSLSIKVEPEMDNTKVERLEKECHHLVEQVCELEQIVHELKHGNLVTKLSLLFPKS
jgi:hypothetical protein